MASPILFTSESVSEGHPDKMADQISDAVLDTIIASDPAARVAVETLVKTGMVVLAGEVSCNGALDLEETVRSVIVDIGYDDSSLGFDGNSCAVLSAIGRQSPDIAQGVDRADPRQQGAGDQGLMFGYASNETDVLMPAAITLSHRLVSRQAEVRRSGDHPWLRPDAKSQVTLTYEDGRPTGIDAVVLSTQHSPDVSQETLREVVMESIIKPVLPAEWLTDNTAYHINPTGQFVIGGPVGDCGLTGRKIIVDTYGGMADRCEVQVSYAIGVAEPTSIAVDTFGTGKLPIDQLTALVRRHFDLTPYGILEMLELVRPIYRQTAAYGHFGREEPDFTWERTDRAEQLKADA